MTRTWWSRSIRARVTALAVVSLAVGLLAGSVALAVLFARGRVHDLDGQARSEAVTIRDLVDSGQLARPLPAAAGTGLLAQVLDAGGTVLAATPSASRLLGLLPPGRLDGWPAGRTGTLRDPTPGGGPLRVAVEHASLRGEPVSVVAAVPLGDVEDTLLALRRTLLVVVPIVVVAAATATWVAVGAALRPVERLRSAADAVHPTGTGTLPALPVPPSRDEVVRLAATLDQMLRRLDDAATRQRAFVADAAHELRSLLASLTTQLEVALAHPQQADWPAVAAD
ncbi:MAG TPA: HAMP domain-containing protein, partial [Frankiaceae bacterium]|nr:HAMP domain-containing protein [Frankiaceae bacterium]